MIRDVFYYGKKPNVHPREKFAVDLNDARQQATTEHFWIINELCDYTDFDWDWDFDFLPDDELWMAEHNNVWPSPYQKDSGTWLCPKNHSDVILYRADVQPIPKKGDVLNNWHNLEHIDVNQFDFGWHPDPGMPPRIYQFGTQWQQTGGPIYTVPGATIVKYIDDQIATRLPSMDLWEIPSNVVLSSFDFSWHHNELDDKPYIYQFGTQWQKTGGPRYVVPGATQVKYINSQTAKVLPHNFENWLVPENIDKATFDFSWHPDETEPPYIYQFASTWEKTGGPRYTVPGASEVKYIDYPKAKALPDLTHWVIPDDIDKDSFDFSWHPDKNEPPFVYQFPTQWQKTNGPKFIAVGATINSPIKYIDQPVARHLPTEKNWEVLMPVEHFDFSWHPDETEPAFIYIFGNQWNRGEIEPTVKYTVPGATQVKYINDIVAKVKHDMSNWKFIHDVETFDFSWRPNPVDPPYIYVFGNNYNDAMTEPTLEYHVPNATQRKYVTDLVATIKVDKTKWEIPENVKVYNFDFTWRPNPHSPAYIYQFGTLLDKNDGPRYITPGNDGTIVYMERQELNLENLDFPKYPIVTSLENLINEHKDEIFWAINPDIDYSNFDFKWVPDKDNVYHINAFGSKDNINTQTYFVNGKMWQQGYRDINYIQDKVVNVKTKIDMFFVDRGNPEAQERYEQLKSRFENIQKTRYLNSWVDTINRCIHKSNTNLFWVVNSELDYSNFEFDYYPSPWQMKMVHVFGTQYSHWGTTFMVNKTSFPDDTKYVKVIEHLSNINFVKRKPAFVTNCIYDIIVIDHGNKETPEIVDTLKKKANNKEVKIIPYNNDYLDTFKDMLKIIPDKKENYVWVCSSICDYSDFDFKYICDPFAREQLHVFPSNKQKFGDTFLVDINKLKSLINNIETLEGYDKVNFNNHQSTTRLPPPVIITNDDTHCESVKQDFNFPYAVFKTNDNKDIHIVDNEPIALWSKETKNIVVTSEGGTRIIVPKEIKQHIKKELYDYPYIIVRDNLSKSMPLDIVFLSNGEKCADENYEHLLNVTKGLPNRIVRVDGVNGRVAAYHAAAKASNTPWMFTVFAKLKIDDKFNWNWQPDRMQVPKHYIFYATNPVNGLKYGHQAMIAYNKKITLANTGTGLDFTMDSEHEVVQVNSGTAMFNTDEWSTWRTAFREAIKLRHDTANISKYRLMRWTNKATGDFAQYSLDGARHAVEYYEEVNGDMDKLKLSYDWPWLRAYFESKYK